MNKALNRNFSLCNVNYLNSVPYQHVARLGWLDYQSCEPARCASLLLEGAVDAALIPVVEIANFGSFEILPFGIASSGNVQSVILGSELPWEKIERIYVDAASRTSVVLLRLLMSEIFGSRADSIEIQRKPAEEIAFQVKGTSAGLLIGNNALREKERFEYLIDLASCWRESRGLPFVFAVWAVRDDVLSADKRAELVDFLARGVEQRSVYARAWADENSANRERAEAYVNGPIEYCLSDGHGRGLSAFLRDAASERLIPRLDSAMEMRLSFTDSTPADACSVGISADVNSVLERSGLEGERLSVLAAERLVNDASLSDLSLAADLALRGGESFEQVSYLMGCEVSLCETGSGQYKEYSSSSHRNIVSRLTNACRNDCAQVSFLGGVDTGSGLEYYEELFSSIKSSCPVDIQAMTAGEISRLSRSLHLSVEEILERLLVSGMSSLSGDDAALLLDSGNCRFGAQVSAAEWLSIHRRAHHVGLRSTCSAAIGMGESWQQRILHLQKLRELQDETSGFLSFEASPSEGSELSVEDYLKFLALARLYLDNFENICVGWRAMGPSVGQIALSFGANDFGLVSCEEGDLSGSFSMTPAEIERSILDIGRSSFRRNSRFQKINRI